MTKKIHAKLIEFQEQKQKTLAYPTKSRNMQEKRAKEIWHAKGWVEKK